MDEPSLLDPWDRGYAAGMEEAARIAELRGATKYQKREPSRLRDAQGVADSAAYYIRKARAAYIKRYER